MKLDMRKKFIQGFAFLGPLGNLIPFPMVPASFRFFYVLLPVGIFIFLKHGISRKAAKGLALLLVLLTLFLLSALYASESTLLFSYHAELKNTTEGNPLIRAILFGNLALFTFLAGHYTARFTPHDRLQLVYLYLTGYAISLVAGYILSIGFQTGLISAATLNLLQIETQMGFGSLASVPRFSPGSYPNEYGIVSSFVAAILVYLIQHYSQLRGTLNSRRGHWQALYPAGLMTLTCLTTGALFLSMTRAAYISFVLSLVYLLLLGLKKRHSFTRTIMGALLLFLAAICIQLFVFDFWSQIYNGFAATGNENLSAYERLRAWQDAVIYFDKSPTFGTGYGTMDMIHNAYLQLFFEFGVLGFAILGTGLAIALAYRPDGNRKTWKHDPVSRFLYHAGNIGILHVLWFAASNHNLNHHLTWWTLLLVLMRSFPQERQAGEPPLPSTALQPARSLVRRRYSD